MISYRLCFFDDFDHIRHVVPLECDSDAHAISTVAPHQDGRELELWAGVRLVRRFARTIEPEGTVTQAG